MSVWAVTDVAVVVVHTWPEYGLGAVNPYDLAEPVIVRQQGLKARKVVGTLFCNDSSLAVGSPAKDEFAGVDDVAHYWSAINGARLFKIQGRSAEPIALDGQYLITHEALPPDRAVRELDGRLVVAVDADGTKYFKRLRRTGRPFVILESLNSDSAFPPQLLGLGEESAFPLLKKVLPVLGVLFELPAPS